MTRFGAGTGALVSFGLDGGGVAARPSSTPLADGQSVKLVGAKSGGPGPHYPGKKDHLLYTLPIATRLRQERLPQHRQLHP